MQFNYQGKPHKVNENSKPITKGFEISWLVIPKLWNNRGRLLQHSRLLTLSLAWSRRLGPLILLSLIQLLVPRFIFGLISTSCSLYSLTYQPPYFLFILLCLARLHGLSFVLLHCQYFNILFSCHPQFSSYSPHWLFPYSLSPSPSLSFMCMLLYCELTILS